MTEVSVGKSRSPGCEECYFRQKMLCAMDLDEPCSSFRESRPEGLTPPRQPVLLLRPPRWADQRPAPGRTLPATG